MDKTRKRVVRPDFRTRMTRVYLGSRRSRMPAGRVSMLPLLFFVFLVLFSYLSGIESGVAYADPSAVSLKDEVKWAIKKLAGTIVVPITKEDNKTIQATLDKVILEAEKERKPIRFGVGILNRDGLAVAGRYIVGTFRVDDFSKYNFVTKAFKQKKILQDRLYFQGGSELLIACVPLIQRKEVVGALVFGFDPSQIKKDYGLTTEQFMALNFNK